MVLSSTPTIGLDLLPGHLTGRSYSSSLLDHNPDASLFDIMGDIERRIIIDKLEHCNWNQTDAAEQFRIPLSTLNQKIKRHSIEIKKRIKEARDELGRVPDKAVESELSVRLCIGKSRSQ